MKIWKDYERGVEKIYFSKSCDELLKKAWWLLLSLQPNVI
jgi:hypothetical protein